MRVYICAREGDQPYSWEYRLRAGRGLLKGKTGQAGSHRQIGSAPRNLESWLQIQRSGPAGSELRRGHYECSHAWGPLASGDPPCLELAESPSKWKLVEELRKMRQQGEPWKEGGKKGIGVQTGARASPHVNLSDRGSIQSNWGPGFSPRLVSDHLCGLN